METISLKKLFNNYENFLDKEVKVNGWIRTNRDSKTFGFIVLSDGTIFSTLQIVYDESLSNFKEVAKYNVGCSLNVIGKIVHTPDAKQKFELHATEISLEGACDETYPIQPKNILLNS